MTGFGKYEDPEQIGEGGFGKVYRARDPSLKRWVAVKTCSMDDPELRERFVREAELAASLRHPNIVTVHDFGREDGEPYLVQEYLEGEDLDDLIRRGEPEGTEARVACLRQVAEALRFAHDRGVVHRDVKPANVRVAPDGRVRLMDFGIARLVDARTRLTRTGMSVGTAGYMSPEQLEGLEVDHRADIFSFGVLAYETTTGRPPFEGDSISTLFYRIAHEDPPPILEAAPGCPPGLAACIERCLRKDREERYAGFGQVLEDLDAVGSGSEAAAAATVPGGRRDAAPAGAGGGATGGPGEEAGAGAEGARASPISRRTKIAVGAGAAVLIVAGLAAAGWAALTGGPEGAAGDAPPAAVADAAPEAEGEHPGAGADGAGGAAGAQTAGPDAGAARGAPGDGRDGAGAGPGGVSDPGTAGAPARDGAGRPAPTADAPAAEGRSGVLVVVTGDARSAPEEAEGVLLGELSAEGHRVMDRTSVDLRARAASEAAASGRVGTLRESTSAAVLVLGELRSDAQPSVGGFYTGSATLTLRAYRTATGDLVVSETFDVGAGDVPGEMGGTPQAALASATEKVAHQAAIALRRALADL